MHVRYATKCLFTHTFTTYTPQTYTGKHLHRHSLTNTLTNTHTNTYTHSNLALMLAGQSATSAPACGVSLRHLCLKESPHVDATSLRKETECTSLCTEALSLCMKASGIHPCGWGMQVTLKEVSACVSGLVQQACSELI